MATLAELRETPTRRSLSGIIVHESVFRSYATLQKVRELLQMDPPVPPKIILEMIDDVMDAPHVNAPIK